jgi:hypothetical protein
VTLGGAVGETTSTGLESEELDAPDAAFLLDQALCSAAATRKIQAY